MNGEDDESGATATTMFLGNNMLFISHVGDSCAVCEFPFPPDFKNHKPN